jgi:hypothetical protein
MTAAKDKKCRILKKTVILFFNDYQIRRVADGANLQAKGSHQKKKTPLPNLGCLFGQKNALLILFVQPFKPILNMTSIVLFKLLPHRRTTKNLTKVSPSLKFLKS